MLALENVSVRKGEFTLEVSNLKIYEGETIAVMGISGSGKTTLLEILAGLEDVTSGEIALSSDMSFGYQNPYLQFFTEKVSSEILFSKPKLEKDRLDEIVDRSLEDFMLPESFKEKSPYELSGGEARRVLLAAISSDEKPYLFLDECLSGLDEKGEEALKALIERRRNSGKTTIFTSHNPDFSAIAERLLILKDGKLCYDGDTRTILGSTENSAEYGLQPTYYASIAENLGLTEVLSRKELVKAIVRAREKVNEK